ncbi:MAG TPA: TIGR04338 family metallohydrolase [Jatrophihabitans sp.]|nr:TIGR04338 family metallohydrolase [Jatrophihabitans sp.]
MRDVQRSKVYAAESLVCRIYDRAEQADTRTVELHGSTITLPIERRFASLESIQRYVNAVLALRWVRARWPTRATVPVTVRARRGHAKAHYEQANATIAIPPHEQNRAWAMRELVLLHELAHHLEPSEVAQPHGPEFTERYATLVAEIVGPEAGLLLRTAMHESGVRMTDGIQL